MTAGGFCKTCAQPVETPGPRYCDEACWQAAAARRRSTGADRARRRRAAFTTAANTTIDTEGAWIVTRVWVGGRIHSEHREPVA